MTRIVEHDLGISWVMDEPMERGSHAIVAGGRVWLVDPVADPRRWSGRRNLARRRP